MKVFINKGKWRDQSVLNMEFEMVSQNIMSGKNGFYVTVDGSPLNANTKNIRIYLKSKNDAVIQGLPTELDYGDDFQEPSHNIPLDGNADIETEQETIERINHRFEILSEMTAACADGLVKGMIVTGLPGCGKSYTVEDTLFSKHSWHLAKYSSSLPHEIIHGNVSPIGLYKKLHEFKDKESVLVFDDSDAVFFDPISLGLLKTALDTTSKRTLSWNSESRVLKDEGIPARFDFHGSVIFITNMDLERTRSKQLKPHFDALISRSHYLDLTIKTRRDKFLRIKDLVKNSDMLEEYKFDDSTKEEILNYMKVNVDRLRELSLRTTIKIADTVKMKPTAWKPICEITICK